jgi:hypothetical protein
MSTAPRIGFKTKGRILFLNLAEIVAVQAEGNYVSLLHRPHPYLLRESLSYMAEKLKPYGFIRIHRSVVVNISSVEEIRPLPTGEYKLRIIRWEGILSNAYVQRQPQEFGATVGRLGTPSRLTARIIYIFNCCSGPQLYRIVGTERSEPPGIGQQLSPYRFAGAKCCSGQQLVSPCH